MAIPSDAHLLAFGRIMHHYGLTEVGIKIAVSAMLRVDLAEALIVLEPTSAAQLINVAKSLAKIKLKPPLSEKFCCIVGEWGAHNGLRNLIAHSRWTDGSEPNSIKPMNLSIRQGHAQFCGNEADEKCYTAQDLETVSKSLAIINKRTLDFLEESGLQHAIEEMLGAEDCPNISPFGGQ